MRTPLLLGLFVSLLAPCSFGQLSLTDVQRAVQALKEDVPFVADLPIDLKAEADGFYYAREVSFLNGTVTVVAYHPKNGESGRLDVALLMKNFAFGTLWSGLGDTPLDQLRLDHPVIIYTHGVKEGAMEKVTLADLPSVVAEAVKVSGMEMYLRRGGNLTSKVDPQQAVNEGVNLLKNVGVDLSDLVLQASFAGGKNILLRRKGEWRQPFQLKNSVLTDATLYVRKTATTKVVAAWGQAKVGSTETFLFAERVSSQGTPVGDAYGLNGQVVSLKLITDLLSALPVQPFPLGGLNALPLDQVKLKNPSFQAPAPGGGIPDLEDCIAFVATTQNVTTPDGKTKGPCLYANGQATVFGFNAADLALRADSSQLFANANVTVPDLGGMSLGSASLRFQNTASVHDLYVAGKISGTVCGVTLAEQDVRLQASGSVFRFDTSVDVGPVAGARAKFASKPQFAFPWSVEVDVTGVAGMVFDQGVELYTASRDALTDLGVKMVEPENVKLAVLSVKHSALFKAAEAWKDIGEEARRSLTSATEWENLARTLPVGAALRSADETLTTVTNAGRGVIGDAVATAQDAGGSAKTFFGVVDSGFKEVGKLFGGGGKKKPKPPPPDLGKMVAEAMNARYVMWAGYKRENLAVLRADCRMSSIGEGTEKGMRDGKPNHPFSDQVTYTATKEEDFPSLRAMFAGSPPIEAIIIETPDNVMREGLKGAVLAIARNYAEMQKSVIEPGAVPQFHITHSGSLTVIQPSMRKPGYRALRKAVEEAADNLAKVPPAPAAPSPDPYAALRQERKNAFVAAHAKLQAETDRIQFLQLFIPAKAKLAVTEVRFLALPTADEPHLFQNLENIAAEEPST